MAVRREIIVNRNTCGIHGKCPFVRLPPYIATHQAHMMEALSELDYEVSTSPINPLDTLEDFRERIRLLVDMDSCTCHQGCTCPDPR